MKDNIVNSFGIATYEKWISMELTNDEGFIYTQSIIGMNVSKYVCLDKEDIEFIGGKEKLVEILNSIELKAEKFKTINMKVYKDILKAIKRVKDKFLIPKKSMKGVRVHCTNCGMDVAFSYYPQHCRKHHKNKR